ncbi:nucleotidyltransferase domain-containing protein [Candidatus Woesearchaeota archaeon]|nr:nucleotidyltransferase domain-containing protein [Candidatus Woesearchaeota archaeon]
MLQNYNKWLVLSVFFDDPVPEGGGFQLRELSRKCKIAPTSVKNYLNELKKEGLITESKHRAKGFPLYTANREKESFKLYKTINTISQIFESGMLKYLYDNYMPNAIILFGSAARGEDTKESDIDLFLMCMETKPELEKFEKKIGKKVNVLAAENFNELSSELKNNIINGIKLNGYLKVF